MGIKKEPGKTPAFCFCTHCVYIAQKNKLSLFILRIVNYIHIVYNNNCKKEVNNPKTYNKGAKQNEIHH